MRKSILRVGMAASVSLVASLAAAQELGGATTISYYRVGNTEFLPNYSTIGWTHEGGQDRLICLTAGNSDFFAIPHLPGGALLRSIEFDGCDTNLANKHMSFVLRGCDYLGNCTVGLAGLSSVDFASDCGYVSQDLTSAAYVVNNFVKSLSLVVTFQSGDDTNKFAGAIIGYQLQVSPAPGTATFNDVPIGHPYFQFVQALVASGVTAGCGGGNYCPDAPLTRGQMAVFLSKALGLSWSQ